MFWTIGFSLLNKVVAFGCQIAITWFLAPKDIGLVAIASSVVGIVSMFLGAQLQRVLVQRQASFQRDASQVLWLSLAMNGAVALLIFLAAGCVARAYGEPELKKLLWIIAAAIPVMAIPVSYGAKLFIDLRFGFINACSFGEGAIRNIGSVLFAAAGFGPASMVIPLLISAGFASLVQRLGAGRIPLHRPVPARWRQLLRPGAWLMVNAFFTSALGYGTTLVIATQHPASVTGLYFWGASMSSQVVFLLVTNLQSVFFPVLSKMEATPDLQRRFFERTVSLSMLVIWPLCFLQIYLAEPVIRLLFREQWLPAAPVVQWLSVGMLTQPLNILGTSLLMSRGSYPKLAYFSGVTAVANLAAAWCGGWLGDQSHIAAFVGFTTLITNAIPGLGAYRLLDGSATELWGICWRPVLVGVFVGVLTFPVAALLAGGAPVTRIMVISVIMAAASVILTKIFAAEFYGILRGFAKEKRRAIIG